MPMQNTAPLQPETIAAEYITQPSPIGVLAGLSSSVGYGSGVEGTYLFVSDKELEDIGAAPVAIRLGGYDPVDRMVKIPRAIETLAVERIELRSAHPFESFVEFDIEWGSVLAKVGSTTVGALGRIDVDSIAGGSRIAFNVEWGKRDSIRVLLACGEHTVRLVFPATGAAVPQAGLPGLHLQVRSGETSNVGFDLRGMGGLDLRLTSHDGNWHSGSLFAQLLYGVPVEGASLPVMNLAFGSPPYSMGPLKPGVYTLVSLGHAEFPSLARPLQFEVEPGRMTRVDSID
ncbi:MAG: hypothetical protein ABL886_10855 [Rhodoglobus sp.]